jgi:hypothetical protein
MPSYTITTANECNDIISLELVRQLFHTMFVQESSETYVDFVEENTAAEALRLHDFRVVALCQPKVGSSHLFEQKKRVRTPLLVTPACRAEPTYLVFSTGLLHLDGQPSGRVGWDGHDLPLFPFKLRIFCQNVRIAKLGTFADDDLNT